MTVTLATLNLSAAAPEILVLAAACGVLLVDAYWSRPDRAIVYWLTQGTLLIAGLLTLQHFTESKELALGGHFVKDGFGDLLKIFLYLILVGVFSYARPYLKERGLLKGEFFVLGLFAVVGMLVMISAATLLTVYLGLELLSLSLYAMVALDRNSATSSEAAMKYFVLGSIASGMLLYGMSMVYGMTGTLDLAQVAKVLMARGGEGSEALILVFATVFVVVGVAFKLGAVPFHMWIPDVYHGSPTAMTLFIGAAPKLAAFAMLIRLLVEGLGPLVGQWQGMIAILATLSIALGNVVAVAQLNIKRMLAYSTISHMGFMLLGVTAGNPAGYGAALFYVITYTLMAAGGFGMVLLLSRAGFEADRLEDFKGLNERSPWFAAMMAILMFSMAGVPPMVGFWAKWEVLQAVVRADQLWIALVAVFFSVIGAWYYLRVVWFMYFEKPQESILLSPAIDNKLIMSLNGLVVLYLGVFPGSLIALCLAVSRF